MSRANISTVAEFPSGVFAENLVVRYDSSILVTDPAAKQIHFVPNQINKISTPVALLRFEQSPMGIVQVRPDIIYVTTSTPFDFNSTKTLWRIDMRGYEPGAPAPIPTSVFEFPPEALFLNGLTMLSPSVLLCADSRSDLIWRIDLPERGTKASLRVWLKHDMLAYSTAPGKEDVPGVNGLQVDGHKNYLYFTNTAQLIFGRVRFHPSTLDPIDEPIHVTDRWMQADDFILDKVAGLAYVTTHRQNSIVRVDLNTGVNSTVVGDPLNLELIGPTAGSWGPKRRDYGKVAYFVTDGGFKNPFNGNVRESRVVKVVFPTGNL
ncbi:hypothetical protein C7974DRAFT_319987 [Boeremia exigua]|uniref:uncharacterized protein n=1 Tax=Boeremia exigua TaxID=749465 RepID=UPI001E8D7A0F|nr:uncharacterized protein C7974DRAFT_319987 [Boeremia exigua]KAH6615395.1 hypothetical protein C7974DRAFT_319987 [Boeremia exigua]